MKRRVFGTTLLLLMGCALLFFFHSRPPTPAIPESITTNTSAPSRPVPTIAAPQPNPVTPSPPPPASTLASRAAQVIPEPPPATLPPETILQNLGRAVHQYGQMFGGNPVGTNPEITAALTGRNPKGINFLRDQPGMTIDGQGELLDPWGTPYFFHQISGSDMELHSAGPDRRLWTADDLVLK